MSVVATVIQLKREDALTFAKRTEIKENGIPRPHLRIKQTTLDKDKQVNRYYRPAMYELADWLCGCQVSNAFFCFVCLLFSDDPVWCKNGVNDLKHLKYKVQKHASSTNHMKNSMSFATLTRIEIPLKLDCRYRESFQGFNAKVSKNRYVLSTIIDCIKFCGAFDLVLGGYHDGDSSVFPGLVNFVSELDSTFKDNLNKSTEFKDIWKSIQDDLLESMLVVVREKIKSEIELTDFLTIQVDEIADSSNEMQMVCIFRYVLNGNVQERFWKFITRAETEDLTDLIFSELHFLNISKNPEKLIAACFTVTNEKFGDIQCRIQENYPSANFIYCYTHQPDLLIQKAVGQYTDLKIFFANLCSFSSFFGKSKKLAILDEAVKVRFRWDFNTRCIGLPKVSSRRDFNARCVESLFENQNDILACLEMIIESEEDYNTLNHAISLKNYLQNEEFLYWLDFFYVLIPHCHILFTQLQDRYTNVCSIKNYIANFNDSIEKVRCKVLIESSETPCETTSNKRLKCDNDKSQIALKVCDVVLSEMHRRFDFSVHLIIAQLFRNEKFEDYRIKFPEEICRLVQRTYPVINSTKLKTELEVLYERDDFNTSVRLITILQFLVNHNLYDTFSESVKLLKILCTLPMTTVESEQCFSTLEQVKTFLHNTTEQNNLCALATLSLEKVLIENIPSFNQKVIDHYAKSKNRRIDLIFKSA